MTSYPYTDINEGDVFVNDRAKVRFIVTKKDGRNIFAMFKDGSCGIVEQRFFDELGLYRRIERYPTVLVKGVKYE